MSTPPSAGKPKPTQKWVSRMGTAVRRSPSLLSRQTTDDAAPAPVPAKAPPKPVAKAAPVSPPPPPPTPAAEPPAAKPQSGNKWAAKLGAATRRNSSSVSLARAADSDAASIKTTGSGESAAPAKEAPGGPKWAAKLGAAAKRSPSMLSLARPTAASAAKNADGDTASLRKSTSRASLVPTPAPKAAPSRPASPSKPAIPVAKKTAKQVSPPPPPVPQPKSVKGAKLATTPLPAAAKSKAPAETAVEKPKPKWTARVGGAVRRSSSLLGATKPITAATPAPTVEAQPAPEAPAPPPAVLLIPADLAHDGDVLAESPTDAAAPRMTAEPEVAFFDEPANILDDARAASPFEDVLGTSETVADAALDHRVDRSLVEEDTRPVSPFADAIVHTVEDVPVSTGTDEIPRSTSPFDDVILQEEVTPVDSAAHEDARPVSPFEDVPPVGQDAEAPEQSLVDVAASRPVPTFEERVVDRPTSPFEDVVAPPKESVFVEESAVERPKSPFEDNVLLEQGDLVVESVAQSTDVTTQLHAEDVGSEPSVVENSSTVDHIPHEPDNALVHSIAPPSDIPQPAPVIASPVAVESTTSLFPDPAFSAVLVDARSILKAKIEHVDVGHIVSSDTEERDLTDEDPFADPQPAQPPAVASANEKDEPWTLVKSYQDHDGEIHVDGHLEVVLEENPWATTVVRPPTTAVAPAKSTLDEESDITQSSDSSETLNSMVLSRPAIPRTQSAPASPTPSPPMLASLAPRPKTPPAPPTATRSTITPTFSTVTTPLRALRAPTLPPTAASVLYHPLAQEDAAEDAESSARGAGYGTATSTSNSTSGNGSGSGEGSVARSTDGGAAGRYACIWHGRPWAWLAHVVPSGLSREPASPKRDPFADPYPPKPRAGAQEEYTAWGSVYEMIAGVIAELSKWIMSKK